jgi:hypothetical protein
MKRFSRTENTIKIIAKAMKEYSVSAIAAVPATESYLSRLLLDAIKKAIRITQREISLIPCFKIPLTVDSVIIDDYRKWLTYYKVESRIGGKDLLEKYVYDPILLCRRDWATRFPKNLSQSTPYSKEEINRLRIRYCDLDAAVDSFNGFNVALVEVGSESDFLAMTDRLDLLEEFTDFLKSALKCPILFGIHHAGTTIPILEEKKFKNVGYLTPINRLGALMLPSKKKALQAIQLTKKPIIAIKPLAGGRITPKSAFEHIFHEVGVDASMVGVASELELDENFKTALEILC